jgi:hypothetical protein
MEIVSMRDILGIEPTALCSDGINKAYVVTQEDLKHFFEFGKSWVQSDVPNDTIIRCKYTSKGDKEANISDDIRTILEYSNPRKKEICNISMIMGAKSKERNFELSFQNYEEPNLIQVYIGGPNLDETQSNFRLLFVELEELTQWYWPIACRRWLIKLLAWVLWILFVLWFSYLLLISVGTTCRNAQLKSQYEQYVKSHPDIVQQNKMDTKLPSPPPQNNSVTQSSPSNPSREIWEFVANKYFLGALGIVIGGWLMVLLANYLFPKAIFEIGKGKERHTRIKAARKFFGYVILTIFLSGIVIPLVTRFVTRQ